MDIANSSVPVKVGMALTADKTVTMFMRYVHTEVRTAAARPGAPSEKVIEVPAPATDTGSRTAAGAYRPFRHRRTGERAVPPGMARLLADKRQEGETIESALQS